MLADLEAWEQHHDEARAAIEQALRITHDLDVPLAPPTPARSTSS